ncbi:hypothetical protein [Enterobacter chengduensis]|uniref:hypothetical protein n=1 Tax=Enterobacter chengduensis TaxID=2494701 RepID=UPI0025518275|nr:hypothetical protein [Enterobacter chengduensis]MEC5767854.1 hypothetical protein [Enterobacter chengduensis]HCD3309359.1 hypothetical protein [Enterobacter chengduensis]
MTKLRFDLDIGVFNSLMHREIKTVLVNLPGLPNRGTVAVVDVKVGKRTVETVECTIVFAEHAGLQASIFNVSLVRGNYEGASHVDETPICRVNLAPVSKKLRDALNENISRIEHTRRKSIRMSIQRKASLLVGKKR